MRKIYFILWVLPLFTFSQTQIGADIDGEAANDAFGSSISISADGSTMAVGAPANDDGATNAGHVRVYKFDGTNWIQYGPDIDGTAINDNFGVSVSLSNNGGILAIGANFADANGTDSGVVKIYEDVGSNWQQLGTDIIGEGDSDFSGSSVSLAYFGNAVAIGAYGNDGSLGNGSFQGHTRIYEFDGLNWAQVGQDINGEASIDQSGFSVSLSQFGDKVAIGAPGNDGNGTNSGHVRVYQNISGVWTQIGQDIDGEASGDASGISVSLSGDGNRVAIGSQNNAGSGPNSGHTRVYGFNGSTWVQLGQDIDGENSNDNSGSSVALSINGNVLIVGATRNDATGTDSGHARVYQFTSGNWVQVGLDIDGEAADDRFGSSVAITEMGDIVAIGARENDGNGSNSGHARVFNVASSLSVDSFSEALQLNIYPNPVMDIIRIDSIEALNSLSIHDINGRLVLQQDNPHSRLNISNLKSGVYFITVEISNNKETIKIIKQ